MSLMYSKPLETDSLNPFFNLHWSTEWTPTSKNLPLLRLPLLALIEVLKSLDPIELFILSLCSRKAANCVHIVGSKKWKLFVDVGNKYILINDTYRLILIETPQKPSWRYYRNLKTFFLEYQDSEERELELQKVLSQLQVAFRCPVTSFKYDGCMRSDQCWVSVLNYIIQNQIQPLESFVLWGTSKNEDLAWTLQNVRVTRTINIRSIGMESFTTDFQPTCEQITMYSRAQLDLLEFKSCKYINLTLPSVTMHDLDVFMKEWKTGSFAILRYMVIGKGKINWVDSILGFKRFEMRQMDVKRSLVIDENLSVDCTGGRDIQSENGTKATMQMDRVSPDCFELFVWKD